MESNGIKTWQWIVTVIVIIALIVLGYYMFSSKSIPTTNNEDSMKVENTQASKEINRVMVSDQFPGNIVYISSVQLAQPGFVVIHKDNAGTPGAIIGYQYFEKGTYPGKITLTSNTIEGGIYYAMLHSDNGDKKFDAAKDLPLKDSTGNTIMKLFRVTNNVTEVKG